jgi:hypothetical protein
MPRTGIPILSQQVPPSARLLRAEQVYHICTSLRTCSLRLIQHDRPEQVHAELSAFP